MPTDAKFWPRKAGKRAGGYWRELVRNILIASEVLGTKLDLIEHLRYILNYGFPFRGLLGSFTSVSPNVLV
jgi:hypothetical protein